MNVKRILFYILLLLLLSGLATGLYLFINSTDDSASNTSTNVPTNTDASILIAKLNKLNQKDGTSNNTSTKSTLVAMPNTSLSKCPPTTIVITKYRPEVFAVGMNVHMYNDASDVCKKLNASLATAE